MLRLAMGFLVAAVVLTQVGPDAVKNFLDHTEVAVEQPAHPARPAPPPQPAAAPVVARAEPQAAIRPQKEEDSDIDFVNTYRRPGHSEVAVAYGEVDLPADRMGQFRSEVFVEGTRVQMLIDTGASLVSLSAEDAARAGVYALPTDRKVTMLTANGQAQATLVKLRKVEIGSIELTDVDAIVMGPNQGKTSLLGMSFLKRLSSVQTRDGRLALKR